MKNVMIANFNKKSHTKIDDLITILKAQLENSLELNWKPEDICILSNFTFEYNGVKAIEINLNDHCLTGSKMFGIQWIIKQNADIVYWAHDLDCWQGEEFECPEFKDVGLAEYSLPKFNGGSVFWRDSAKDIVDAIVEYIEKHKSPKEEPVLNKILKSDLLMNSVHLYLTN
jgi:hypothetical protein